jgi:hypothetical protein
MNEVASKVFNDITSVLTYEISKVLNEIPNRITAAQINSAITAIHDNIIYKARLDAVDQKLDALDVKLAQILQCVEESTRRPNPVPKLKQIASKMLYIISLMLPVAVVVVAIALTISASNSDEVKNALARVAIANVRWGGLALKSGLVIAGIVVLTYGCWSLVKSFKQTHPKPDTTPGFVLLGIGTILCALAVQSSSSTELAPAQVPAAQSPATPVKP